MMKKILLLTFILAGIFQGYAHNLAKIAYKKLENNKSNYLIGEPIVGTTTATPTTICSGGNSSLVSTATGADTYEWQQLVNGSWNTIATGNVVAGAAQLSLSNLTATTSYQCKFTNTNGSRTSSVVSVTVSRPTITTQPASQTDCEGNDIVFGVVATGDAPLTYQWYRNGTLLADNGTSITGATTNALKVDNIGSATNPHLTEYYCIIKDKNGCQTIANTAVMSVNTINKITSPTAICAGGGTSFNVVYVGTQTQIVWQKQLAGSSTWTDIANANSSTLVLNNVPFSDNNSKYRTKITFTITENNDNGGVNTTTCVRTQVAADAGTLTVNPLPTTPIPTSNSPICAGTTLTLSANVSGAIYAWKGPNGFTSAVQNPSLSPATTAMSGIYSLIVTDAKGCSSLAGTVNVVVNPLPIISLGSVADICNNVTAFSLPYSATSNSPDKYSITAASPTVSGFSTITDNGLGGSSINVGIPVNTTANTYQFGITVKNSSTSCVSTVQNFSVKVNATPAAPAVTTPVNICQDASPVPALSATATGANTLQWYAFNGSVSTTPTVPSLASVGTIIYYVSQKSPENCESSKTGITVTVNAVPAKPTTQTIISYCLNDKASILSATGASGNTILWYNSAKQSLASAPTPTTTVVGTQTYYVSQKTPSPAFCESQLETITVTINPLPTAPTVTSPVGFCQNTTATALSATPTGSNSLLWYGTNVANASPSTTATVPSTATSGTFSYYVSQKDGNNCSSPQAKIDVIITPAVTVTVSGSDAICNSGELNKTATQTATASGGNGVYTYQWQKSSSDILGAINTTYDVSAAGTYTVVVKSGYCTVTSSSKNILEGGVKSDDIPTVTGNSATCGATATLTASSKYVGGTFKWYKELSDASPLFTGNPYTTPTLTANSYYYVARELAISSSVSCQGSRTKIDVTVASSTAPIVASVVTYCQNATPTALTATGINLLWYTIASGGTGSTSAPIPVTTSAGTIAYYVSQTVNGCESNRSKIDVIVTAITADATASAILCAGGNSTVTVNGLSGISPYAYSKDGTNFQSNATFAGLVAGNYTFTVKDANNCSAEKKLTITEPTPITIALAKTDETCLGALNGKISITTSGGTGTLTYSKDGSGFQTSNEFTGLSAGNYTITVKDENGCTKTATSTINAGQTINFTVGTSSAICNLATSFSLPYTLTSGSADKYSLTATMPNFVAVSEAILPSSPILVSIPAGNVGTFSFTLTLKNSSLGCSKSQLFSVTVSSPLVGGSIEVSPTATYCAGYNPGSISSVSLASGGQTPYIYQWQSSTDGTNFSDITSATATTYDPAGLTQTTYFRRKVTDACGAIAYSSNIHKITIVPDPTVTTSVDKATICTGQQATFTINITELGAGTCTTTWKSSTSASMTSAVTEGTGNSLAITFTNTGTVALTKYVQATYSCNVGSCNNATSTPIAITINPAPSVPILTGGATICTGESATLSASNCNGIVTWSNNATTTTITVSTAGSYTATCTNSCGTSVASNAVTIALKTKPDAPISSTPTSVCQGTTLTFSATVSSGTTPNLLWYTSATGGNGSTTAPTYTAAGTYTAYVSQTVNGCESDRISITATINALSISTQPQDLTKCKGNSASFSVSVVPATATYQWQKKAVGESSFSDIFGATSATLSFTAGTTYLDQTEFQCIVSANGCNLMSNVAKLAVNSMTGTLASQTVCVNANVTFDLSSFTITGNIQSYQWLKRTGSSGSFVTISGETNASLTLQNITNASNDTYYECKITFASGMPPSGMPPSGCSITTDDAHLTINTIVITPTQTNVTCNAGTDGSISVVASGGSSPYTYSKDGTNFQSSSAFTNLGAGTYTITVKDKIGCLATNTITITEPPIIIVALSKTDVNCSGAAEGKIVVTASGGIGTLRYSKDGTIFQTSNEFTGLLSGSYAITVKDVSNCIKSSTITINAGNTTILPVNTTPAIVCQGNIVTFSATGSSLLWYTSSTGGTGSSTAPSYTAGGTYTVYVSQMVNGCESSRLKVDATIPTPSITVQPSNQSDCDGNSVTFNVTASTTTGGTLSYQWQSKKPTDANFVTIANATNSTLSVSNVGDTTNPAGSQYQVIITESGCSITSNIATLLVNTSTGSLANQTQCAGANATFDVNNFITTSTPTYQWQKRVGTSGSWNDVLGATASTLSLANLTTNDEAYYRCKFTFTNLDGTTCIKYTSTGNGAKLTLNPTPTTPIISPTTATICTAQTAQLTATNCTGTVNWQNAGQAINQTGSVVTVSSSGTYTATCTNNCGISDNSNTATITVLDGTAIVSPAITSITPSCVPTGENTVVTLTADCGTNQVIWYDATTQIGTGTAISITVGGANTYFAACSNNVCISSKTPFVVNATPAISVQPSSQTDCKSSSVSFSVTATGNNLTYQWQRKKVGETNFLTLDDAMTGIDGALKAKLNLTSVGTQNPDSSLYRVIISSNNACSITSNSALLHVNSLAGSLASQTICTNSSTNFNVTNFAIKGNAINYQWQTRTGTSGTWNTIAGATNDTLNFVNVDSTAYYRCRIIFDNGDGTTCIIATDDAKLTVSEKPILPINQTPSQVCAGKTLTFSAKGTKIKWYETATGGTATSTAPKFTETGIYTRYATQTIDGCESDRVLIKGEIKTKTPLPINTTPEYVTYPSVLKFSANGTNLRWFKTATTTTSTATAPIFTVGGTYNYWVGQRDSMGCESDRLKITATLIEKFRIIHQPLSQVDCEAGSVLFNVTAVAPKTIAYQWQRKRPNETEFTNLVNGNGISGATVKGMKVSSIGNANNPAGTLYRCLLFDGTNAITTDEVSLSVNAVIGNLPNLSTCEGLDYEINLPKFFQIYGTPTRIQWQTRQGTSGVWTDMNDAGNIVGTKSLKLAFSKITALNSAYYRAKFIFATAPKIDSCFQYTDATKLTIGTFPVAPLVNDYTFCQFEKTKKIVISDNANLTEIFYPQEMGGVGSTTAPTPYTQQAGEYFYYVSQRTKEGCESPRSKIKITVHALPEPPINTTPAEVKEGNVLTFSADKTTPNEQNNWHTDLRWYTTATDKIPDYTAPIYEKIGHYKTYVSQVNGFGCESFRTEILAAIVPILKITKQPISQTDCEGNSVTFSITTKDNVGAISYQWQRKRPTETTFVPIDGATAKSLTIKDIGDDENPDLSEYQCVIIDAEGTTKSVPATLFVNQIIGSLSDSYLCGKSSTTLSFDSLVIKGTVVSYQWQKKTGNSYATILTNQDGTATVNEAGTYRGRVIFYIDGKATCPKNTNDIKVIAKPDAVSLTVANKTICQHINFDLVKFVNPVKGNYVLWYESQEDSTGDKITPKIDVSQVGKTTFYVSQSTAFGCESNRKMFTITVAEIPTKPIVSDTTFCRHAPSDILTAITADDNGLLWYATLKTKNPFDDVPIPSTKKDTTISYFVSAINADGCESERAEKKVVIAPCIGIITGNDCLEISADSVKGNRWYDLYDANGGLYASVNPNGLNLGKVTAKVRHYGRGAKTIPMMEYGTQVMARYLDFQSSLLSDSVFKKTVLLKIYYLNDELEEYKEAINLPNFTINDFKIVHYDGIRESCGFEDNDNFMYGNSYVIYKNVLGKQTTKDFFELQFEVEEFSENGATANDFAQATLKAEKQFNNTVKLTWNTTLEVREVKYILQRSNDCKTWRTIGEVSAKGTGTTYEKIDYLPLAGQNCYRLVYIDKYGTKKYLDPATVTFADTDPICTVYPNPVTTYQLDLYLRNIQAKEIHLYNIAGQEIGVTYQKNENDIIRIIPAGKLQDFVFVVTFDENGKRCIEKIFVR